MKEVIYEHAVCGLGSTLGMVSVMKHIPNPVIIRCEDQPTTDFVNLLLTIFKIPSNEVKCVVGELFYPSLAGVHMDLLKEFSPYHKPEVFSLFGNDVPVNTNKKPCAILAKTGNVSVSFDTLDEINEQPSFPNNRYYSVKEYASIYSLLTRAGYDVISLDNLYITIEEKIEIMNSFGDVFVGYEGGLAHLSHMLRIPTIILPWHHSPDGVDFLPEENKCHHPHTLHIDDDIYFVSDIEEILNWNTTDLLTIIDKLKNNEGNHPVLNSDTKITIKNDDTFINGHIISTPKYIRKFLFDNLPELRYGGKFMKAEQIQ